MCRGLCHSLTRHDHARLSTHFSSEMRPVGVALYDCNLDTTLLGAAARGYTRGAEGLRERATAHDEQMARLVQGLGRVGVGLLMVSGSMEEKLADCCAAHGVAILPAAGAFCARPL